MPTLSLFAGAGVELEYMIVAHDSLSVLPIADQALATGAGEPDTLVEEIERGPVGWSNELVLHVLEMKTNGPVMEPGGLQTLEQTFQQSIHDANAILNPMGGCLLPTAMHPWMDPGTETTLWPHQNRAYYDTFDRIFNCKGHGWSNLQSVHLNLPFANDEEFAKLHAAIRVLLPLLPALAASSPLVEGQRTENLDNRLAFYRANCARIPSVTGQVIPEAAFSQADYECHILEPMYVEIAPHDPEGILHHEWLNARGAIARFERNTVEIRVLDVQECPAADIAICRLIFVVLQALIQERWASLQTLYHWPQPPLLDLLNGTIRAADLTPLEDANYRALFGLTTHGSHTAGDLWRHLYSTLALSLSDAQTAAITTILDHGTLARRIAQALGDRPNPARLALAEVYRQLARCLQLGESFIPTIS